MRIPPFPFLLAVVGLCLAMPIDASSIALSGQVLDSASGTPLANISVSLVEAGLSTATDANGYWSLQGTTGIVERSEATANLSRHLVLRNGRIIILFDRSDASGRIVPASSAATPTSTARSAARALASDRDTIAYSQYGYQLATRNIGSYSQPVSIQRINPGQWTFLVDPRDNQKYRTVSIGNLTWMAQNLNYAASGSTCPLNDTAYCHLYGRMYSWAGAMGVSDSFNSIRLNPVLPFQGLCPSGWHIPADSEWNLLLAKDLDSSIAGKLLKANSHLWYANTGKDEFGFSVLPAGDHIGSYGGAMGLHSNFWSTAESDATHSWRRIFDYDADTVRHKNDVSKSNGMSIRCVEGQGGRSSKPDTAAVVDTVPHGTFVDSRDNRTYAWTRIGSQTWMAQNLDYAASGSNCPLNDTSYCPTYGRMYDWSTAMDVSDSFNTAVLSPSLPHRGICPSGWHIPSDSEWDRLLETALDSSTAGKQLKADSPLWLTNTGTDNRHFSALPAGDHIGSVGGAMGLHANFWSSSERVQAYAWRRILDHDENAVRRQSDVTKSNGMSVRCVEDVTPE